MAPVPYTLFVDPTDLSPLNYDELEGSLVGRTFQVMIENGVVDFSQRADLGDRSADDEHAAREHGTGVSAQVDHAPETVEDGRGALVAAPNDGPSDSAPELRAAHDRAFDAAEDGNIYGSLDDAAAITQSGHRRRMEILDSLDLGDLSDAVAVDFGTGPWGFSAIFEKLQRARVKIGFDVSGRALHMARAATPEIDGTTTIYATSDGEVIPLADDSVDVFFGGEVIEHVRNPRQFLQEVARVCRDGARIVLTTPNHAAFMYRLRDLQYCTGPEHIALLDRGTFQSLLELFSDRVQMFGYETSIALGYDELSASDELLDAYQRRSFDHPDLATGLISLSRVAKQRFRANRRSMMLSETINDGAAAAYSVEPQTVHLFDEVTGSLLGAESALELTASGTELSLLFWGHDWSGYVEIELGSSTTVHDLYAPVGGFIRIDLENDEGVQQLTVRPTGTHRAESNDAQAIFYKLIEYRIDD